jgi:hypothetical protein
MSTFWSSTLRLMPPQLNERVGKWTHEPQSNLNHKKHLSDTFICTSIFSIKLFRKYKNIFTFLHTHTKPTNIITASYLLYCIVIYFTVLHIIFYFYLHSHLVLGNHLVELGTQEQGIVLQVARRRMTRAFATVPQEFDINPKFPRGENLLFLQHSTLGFPTWYTCLVSSASLSTLVTEKFTPLSLIKLDMDTPRNPLPNIESMTIIFYGKLFAILYTLFSFNLMLLLLVIVT